jgi:hypothetical protein
VDHHHGLPYHLHHHLLHPPSTNFLHWDRTLQLIRQGSPLSRTQENVCSPARWSEPRFSFYSSHRLARVSLLVVGAC